tara:strand:- start:6220 stop:6405 length:186 start_codon:yes stop_codon:yes gene_type:complete
MFTKKPKEEVKEVAVEKPKKDEPSVDKKIQDLVNDIYFIQKDVKWLCGKMEIVLGRMGLDK